MLSTFYDNITNTLFDYLDSPRIVHSIGVTHVVLVLAKHYGVSMTAAATAGLLHDCAKQHSQEDLVSFSHQSMLGERSEIHFIDFPKLLHAPASSVLAHDIFKVEDDEVLDAICFHPTGRPQPSILLKILMIADFTEPSRKRTPCAELLEMATNDLDEAFLQMLKIKENYLRNIKNVPIHPLMKLTLESELNLRDGRTCVCDDSKYFR